MEICTVSFFGHRYIDYPAKVQDALFKTIKKLVNEKDYVEFLVGKNGEFDFIAALTVRSVQMKVNSDNSSLHLILPYETAEYKNSIDHLKKQYDKISICRQSAAAQYKAAITVRNRHMVDRSDIIICYVKEDHGGAFKAHEYAKKNNCEIINLADMSPDPQQIP